MLLLTEEDVKSLLSMKDVMKTLERAFRDYANGISEVPPRITIPVPGVLGNMRILAATRVRSNDSLPPSPSYLGCKVYTGYVGPVFKDLSKPRFVILLYDARSGELLSVLAARWLGLMRTGGAAGLATKYVYKGRGGVAFVVGAGEQAVGQVLALNEAIRIDTFYVYARSEEHTKSFCDEMGEMLGKEFIPVRSAQEAVNRVDLIDTVTNSREPVLKGEWLKDDTSYHINAVGANVENRRELDDSISSRAVFIVEHMAQSMQEAGDVIMPLKDGLIEKKYIYELGDIIAGKASLDNLAKNVTVFKSIGIGLEDVAVAAFVYEQAIEKGVGILR